MTLQFRTSNVRFFACAFHSHNHGNSAKIISESQVRKCFYVDAASAAYLWRPVYRTTLVSEVLILLQVVGCLQKWTWRNESSVKR
jgi:hypothetical protein